MVKTFRLLLCGFGEIIQELNIWLLCSWTRFNPNILYSSPILPRNYPWAQKQEHSQVRPNSYSIHFSLQKKPREKSTSDLSSASSMWKSVAAVGFPDSVYDQMTVQQLPDHLVQLLRYIYISRTVLIISLPGHWKSWSVIIRLAPCTVSRSWWFSTVSWPRYKVSRTEPEMFPGV